MTRRSSTRAQAQEFYGQMVADDARGSLSKGPPHPSPLPPGERGHAVRGEREVPAMQTTDLTARARALYEGSGVPVREIARLAGVSERTIYKYAAKQSWRPRYRWMADGSRPAGAPRETRRGRGCGWRPPASLAPAKSAGGRFVRREEAGKPFARGLKAIDPAGERRAAARCAVAARRAALAEAEAQAEHWCDENVRAIQDVNRARHELAAHLAACKQKPRPARADLQERLLTLSLQVAAERMKVASAAWCAAVASFAR